jgi:hypothetical protein
MKDDFTEKLHIKKGALVDVMRAKIGERVHGHTVTPLMKKRVKLALALHLLRKGWR